MRNRYLVAYDIMDPDRLRVMRRTMLGFGDPLQYSVFLCELSPKERAIMVPTLSDVIRLSEDRVLIVDLGPVGGKGDECMEFLGRPHEVEDRGSVIV